jgi:hypothetical protein
MGDGVAVASGCVAPAVEDDEQGGYW